MKKLSLTIASFLLFFGISSSIYAQGQGQSNVQDNSTDQHDLGIKITGHSMLRIVGPNSTPGSTIIINLNPNDPTAPGDGIDFANLNNSDLWLNYSVIKSSGQTYSINGSIDRGDLPAGITIDVMTSTPSGKGDVGTEAGTQSFPNSGAEIPVVTKIGSCHTGVGVSNGSNLIYTANFDDTSAHYADLVAGSYTATITYTISAD